MRAAVHAGRRESPAFAPPAELGVGLSFLSRLPEPFWRSAGADFVEVVPETLCVAARRGDGVAIVPDRARVMDARATCGDLPMVAHGVELSIGSAHGWNGAYLPMLDAFRALWDFRWHSEHLHFQTAAAADGRTLQTGVPLPIPPTEEAAALVARRARAIGRRFEPVFLLENPAHYLADLPADESIGDELGLMNRVLERSACGQLLDLHNLYCNAVNLGFDPFAALDRVRLDRVVEVHVAGGEWRDGFLTDSHGARVPAPVWDLLAEVLARPSAIAGVVFELLEEHFDRVGARAIEGELQRLRDRWDRRRKKAPAARVAEVAV